MAEEAIIPPHDLPAEASIISLIILFPDILRRVMPLLKASDFYSRSHEEIYAACVELFKRGTHPDIVTLASYLKDTGKLEMIGNMAYLTQIVNAAPGTANATAYAKIISGRANVRKLISAANSIVAKGYGSHGDDSDFLLQSGAAVHDICRVADKSAIVSNKEALRQVFLNIQSAAARGSDISGLKTGIDDYDRLTTGLHAKQLTIVAARPGGGKSARLLQIATEVAKQGIGVVFFSLEMTREELCARQVSMFSKVDTTNLSTGRLTREDWTKVTAAVGEISTLPIFIDDTPDLTIYQIRERTLGAIDNGVISGVPVGLVCIDYIQRLRVDPADRKLARYEQVGQFVQGAKELAKQANIPIVAAAQLRRVPEGRPSKRPSMDEIRESGSIEQESDIICCLFRDSQYNKSAKPDEAEFIVVKNRHGADGVVDVGWDAPHTLFTNKKPAY